MRTPGSLLSNVSIAELWPRYKRRSSSRVNEMQPPDSSSRRAIRTRLLLGSKTLSGSFTSSTFVQSVCWPFANSAVPFQIELVIDIHMMVADVHQNMLTGQESPSGQHHSVGATRSSITECLPPSRLKPGQRYRIVWGPQFYVFIVCLLVNPLPPRRGTVSAATT